MTSRATAVSPGCRNISTRLSNKCLCLTSRWVPVRHPPWGMTSLMKKKTNLPPELLASRMQLTSDRLGGSRCGGVSDPSLSALDYVLGSFHWLDSNVFALSASYSLVSVLIQMQLKQILFPLHQTLGYIKRWVTHHSCLGETLKVLQRSGKLHTTAISMETISTTKANGPLLNTEALMRLHTHKNYIACWLFPLAGITN